MSIPAFSTAINQSLFTQGANFVQSNDLIYRTALDMTGFNLPLYASARSDDERRESLTNIVVSTAAAFLFAPLYVMGFNKLMAQWLLPEKNEGFFHLQWDALDDKTAKNAIERLHLLDKRIQDRLAKGNRFDQLGFVKKGLAKTSQQFKQAIETLNTNPQVLEKVKQSKLLVLLADLVLTASIVNLTDPIAMWMTKQLSHHDRFTGSEAYLSDADLAKLQQAKVGNSPNKPTTPTTLSSSSPEKSRVTPSKLAFHILFTLLPALTVLATHKTAEAFTHQGKAMPAWLHSLRNSLDYTSGLYMTLGGLFFIFLANNLTHSLWARDQYERAEIVVKYGLILPSFCFGDHLFNGNIAKLADKALAKAGTFINTKHPSWWGAEPKHIQAAMEQVAQTYNSPKKTEQAGNIATSIFLSGFVAHSLAMMGIFALGNAITRRWITKDLTALKQTTQQPPQPQPKPIESTSLATH
jgi:hypothetical protein